MIVITSLDGMKNILSRSILIKHDTFNNQVSSRLTQNWFKTGPWHYICMPFLYSHPHCFWVFLQIVKQQIGKTSKIGYNWIFITNIFLKMDEKTYLKGSQNGLVRVWVKILFSKVSNVCFLCRLCWGALRINKEALT